MRLFVMKLNVLIADRNAHVANELAYLLRDSGKYTVESCASHDEIFNRKFDVLLFSLDYSEFDFPQLASLNAYCGKTPILAYSQDDSLNRRIQAINLGVAMFIKVPFASSELLARVRALARRLLYKQTGVVRQGPQCYEIDGHQVTVSREEMQLSARELVLLTTLIRWPGRIVTREQIVEQFVTCGDRISTKSIDTYIHNLRRKLSDDSVRIITSRGIGYRIERTHETTKGKPNSRCLRRKELRMLCDWLIALAFGVFFWSFRMEWTMLQD